MENEVEQIDTKMDDQVQLELSDGTESSIADSSEVNAIKTTDPIVIKFETGNYDGFIDLGQRFSQGILTITNTLVPLIEAGLIELLGNSSAYTRIDGTINSKIVGTTPIFDFSFQYKVSLWIGSDIQKEAVLEDATYVYTKINIITNTKFKECKIDTATGLLSIEGSLTTQ